MWGPTRRPRELVVGAQEEPGGARGRDPPRFLPDAGIREDFGRQTHTTFGPLDLRFWQ